MAFLVERPVYIHLPASGRVLLDVRDRPELAGDEVSQVIGIIACIHDDLTDPGEPRDQPPSLWAIPPVSGSDQEADRKSQGIDGGMDLGGQAATGTADCGSFKPPF